MEIKNLYIYIYSNLKIVINYYLIQTELKQVTFEKLT